MSHFLFRHKREIKLSYLRTLLLLLLLDIYQHVFIRHTVDPKA